MFPTDSLHYIDFQIQNAGILQAVGLLKVQQNIHKLLPLQNLKILKLIRTSEHLKFFFQQIFPPVFHSAAKRKQVYGTVTRILEGHMIYISCLQNHQMAKAAKDFTFFQNFCVSNHRHNLYKGKLKHKNKKSTLFMQRDANASRCQTSCQ